MKNLSGATAGKDDKSKIEYSVSKITVPQEIVTEVHAFVKRLFIVDDHSLFTSAIDAIFSQLTASNLTITSDELVRTLREELRAFKKERIWLANSFSLNRGHRLSNQITNFLSLSLPNQCIVDIGCSDGGMLRRISETAETKINLIGVDIIDKGLEDPAFKYYKVDADHPTLPIKDRSVNVVTMLMVLHHSASFTKLIEEANRILKTDGLLIVKEHNAASAKQRIYLELIDRILSEVLFDLNLTATLNYKNLTEWVAEIELFDFKLKQKIETRGDGFLVFEVNPKIDVKFNCPRTMETKLC